MIDLGQVCAFCHLGITPEQRDDPDAVYREVVSWVTGPKLQGPVMREQTWRMAHATCVRKVLDGQSPDQEPLPGFEDS